MKAKTQRRALLMSALSLLLCVSMLVGTTFAWFTDSVTSGANVIASGNLDVELEYYNGASWEKVDQNTNVFKQNTLWEPGHTEIVYLKVSNLGTLALKYKLGINIAEETDSVNVNNEAFKLSDYIQVGIVKGLDENNLFATREDARNAQFEQDKLIKEGYVTESQLYPTNNVPAAGGNTAEYVAMVVYMPETVGNDANYKKGENVPEILLGLNLQATQVNYESDSFDSTYDIDAEYKANNNSPSAPSFFVGSAADLAAAMTPTVSNDEVKIVLTQDIELAAGETWTPLTLAAYGGTVRNIVIDGQGHTIKGLNAPLIGHAYFGNTSIEIKNLTLSKANIEGAGFNGTGLGAFVGAADNCAHVTFTNCHLTNSTITCTNDVTGVGGIIGFSSSPLTMTNCSVTNTTVNGANDSVGALIGHTYESTITNAKVVGCTLSGDGANKTGYVVGTVNANTTITTSADCAGNTVFGTADSTTVYGRIVGATLTLNGVTLP